MRAEFLRAARYALTAVEYEDNRMATKQEQALLTEFKYRAEQALPGRISRMVLFGSRARGDAGPDSDWDIAVFINQQVSSWDTLKLADAAYDLILDTGQFIQPLALSDGEASPNDPLRKEIERDGETL